MQALHELQRQQVAVHHQTEQLLNCSIGRHAGRHPDEHVHAQCIVHMCLCTLSQPEIGYADDHQASTLMNMFLYYIFGRYLDQ